MTLAEATTGLLPQLWDFVQDYPDPVLFGMFVLCGVGLPIPEEPILLMAGAVAVELSSGGKATWEGAQLQLVRIMAVCAVGILCGDILTFHLGRTLGRRVLRVPLVKTLATRPRRVRAERFFQRYGPWAIFIARFFAGVRLVMYFSAGMSHRVSYLRFLFMDFLGVLVSVPVSVYIGFLVYREFSDWHAAKKELRMFHLIMIVAVAVGLLVWLVIARKKRAAERRMIRSGRVVD